MIKTAISQVNLKNLYFPNDILNKKFPKWLVTQALICAINFNSLEVAELLLLLGANAKIWDKKTGAPIIESLYKKRNVIDKILYNYGRSIGEKLLLSHGAMENVSPDWNKLSIINETLYPHNFNIKIKSLINSGNINAKNYYDDTPLTCAAKYNNLEIVKELINSGANLDAKDYDGNTALMYAVEKNNLEAVKILIKSGANMNLKNGATVLTWAFKHGHLDIVKKAIKTGADVNATDRSGNPILITAYKHVYSNMPSIFASNKIHLESIKEPIEIIQQLIKAGANINATDKSGRTILILASENGHLDIIKKLINSGADVNATDEYGWTALVCSSYNGHREIVKELIKAGANIKKISLVKACKNGHLEIVKELIRAGANAKGISLVQACKKWTSGYRQRINKCWR